jgi:ribosomal protein S11
MSETFVFGSRSTTAAVRTSNAATSADVVSVKANKSRNRSRDAQTVEAVYAHIQSARAHGMTSINTLDIADALNLPSKRVESAIRALRNRGVKVKR